jgi:aspartyl/asparaginyl beta-hydroxylase (cupin superfamily)
MSNAKLRGHFGLLVPPSGDPSSDGDGTAEAIYATRSALRVGQETQTWVEGQTLVFDDSFEHEVWWQWAPNERVTTDGAAKFESASARYVLIVDVFHPELPVHERGEIRRQFGSTNAN